jgi:hypothetical protein
MQHDLHHFSRHPHALNPAIASETPALCGRFSFSESHGRLAAHHKSTE